MDINSKAYIAAEEHKSLLSRDGLCEGETIDIKPCPSDSEFPGGYEVVKRQDGKIQDIITFDADGVHQW